MDNLAITLSKWAVLPVHYERDRKWALALPYSTAANRYTLVSPGILSVNVNNVGYAITSQVSLDLSVVEKPTDHLSRLGITVEEAEEMVTTVKAELVKI